MASSIDKKDLNNLALTNCAFYWLSILDALRNGPHDGLILANQLIAGPFVNLWFES
ncbi:hypothetical protein P8935_01665 [Telmatobacter sp. DSM 110680]|uniref:Uncharacterized protein n=1 Tax=Telmatobacter sp. DSM 110680 TaxID=3036704 RepID=A0AAU7DLV0_9BACT